jgi:FkbM family methyltransferase
VISVPTTIARIPIIRGLFRRALLAYAKCFKKRYTLEKRLGLLLLLDSVNIIGKQVLYMGSWEQPQLDQLFGMVKKYQSQHIDKTIFLDVGAHWGLYALFADHSGHFEQVIAIEPDPTNYCQLQANLFLNQATTSVRALRLAATDRERTLSLEPDTQDNRGGTRVVELHRETTLTCRGERIDSLLDVEGKLLVIKIDVEGHEVEVVKGLGTLLSKNRFILQIEIWREPDGAIGRRFGELSILFSSHGIKFVHSIDSDFYFVSQDFYDVADDGKPRL